MLALSRGHSTKNVGTFEKDSTAAGQPVDRSTLRVTDLIKESIDVAVWSYGAYKCIYPTRCVPGQAVGCSLSAYNMCSMKEQLKRGGLQDI